MNLEELAAKAELAHEWDSETGKPHESAVVRFGIGSRLEFSVNEDGEVMLYVANGKNGAAYNMDSTDFAPVAAYCLQKIQEAQDAKG